MNKKSLEPRAEGGNKLSEHIWIASAEYLCNIWKTSLEFKGPPFSFNFFSVPAFYIFKATYLSADRHVNTPKVMYVEAS